jgi:hypothetical protein
MCGSELERARELIKEFEARLQEQAIGGLILQARHSK